MAIFSSLLVGKALVNSSYLILDVDICVPTICVAVKAVESNLLPASLLVLGDGLASHRIKNIRPLARQPLEVLSNIDCGQIRCGITSFGFGFLLFPLRIKKFD